MGVEAFAGAQVEGDARPAGGVDFAAQGGVGFGAAVWRDFVFFGVAFAAVGGGVLAAHGVAFGVERFEAADELQLGVAHVVGRQGFRALHGGETEHLHDVVLHHVAQGADGVVGFAALFDAETLGSGDFYGCDMLAVPQRLEQSVAKAQGGEILQAFFTQVVVDAVDLPFGEVLRDVVVDAAAGGKVSAQRFFQYDAHVFPVQPGLCQMAAGLGEEFGCGGQIDDNGRVRFLRGLRGERGEVLRLGDVQRQVADACGKRRPLFGRDLAEGDFAFFADSVQIGVAAETAAADADDASLRVQRSGDVGVEEGGQQFAHRQIAGGAE